MRRDQWVRREVTLTWRERRRFSGVSLEGRVGVIFGELVSEV